MPTLIVDGEQEKIPHDVLVIREFLDAFLENMPSIPLDREIKFQINFVLRTLLILKAPTR